MRMHSNRRKKKYRPFGAAFLVVLAVDIVGGSGSNYNTKSAASAPYTPPIAYKKKPKHNPWALSTA
jgi:hypothetical protein